MNDQTHEKYVSIEYDKWENFYKPLENKLLDAQNALIEERKRKQHVIIGRTNLYGYRNNHTIATLDFVEDGVFFVQDIAKKEFFNTLWLEFKDYAQERYGNKKIILTREDVKNTVDQLDAAYKRNKDFQEPFITWYNTLPKFIKWLFKLKPKPNE